MKELSVQEKAKAYDEAIEYAYYLISERCKEGTEGSFHRSDLQKMFPTLAEGEDERIRQDIIETIKKEAKEFPSSVIASKCKTWLSWLEKQGEQKQDVNMQINPSEYINDMGGNGCYLKNTTQKPTDKVEPKFKVGDWVVSPNGVYWHIDAIRNGRYKVSAQSGECADWPLDTNIYHRFTIQDAKDGDVLVDGNLPFIFKNIDTNKYSYAYCGISVDDGFKIESDGEFGEWTWMQDIKPATKEQRDLLFQKMKEAGYEWDADKKVLKKIEQNPTNEEMKEILQTEYEKGRADAIAEMQKPAEYEMPLLEKFKQAVYDCAWGKVTCKKEGETKEEYANRWAEHFLLMVRDWADDYIDFTIQQKLRNSYEKGKTDIIEKQGEQKPTDNVKPKYKVDRIDNSIGNDRFLSEYEKGCNQGKEEVCDTLRNFLDTLEVKEVQEEPVSEDLEKAAIEAFKQIVDTDKNNFLEIFKAGAKWKEEQMMKEAIDAEASYTMSVPCITISLPLGVNVGDKVKVIIIKSE